MSIRFKIAPDAVFYILIIIFISGHLTSFQIREFWPFSAYPMYSRAFKPTNILNYKLMGVASNGNEFAIKVAANFRPFWDAALNEALQASNSKKNINLILSDLLNRYNSQNKSKISRLRLYQLSYNFQDQKNRVTDNSIAYFYPPKESVLIKEALAP